MVEYLQKLFHISNIGTRVWLRLTICLIFQKPTVSLNFFVDDTTISVTFHMSNQEQQYSMNTYECLITLLFYSMLFTLPLLVDGF